MPRGRKPGKRPEPTLRQLEYLGFIREYYEKNDHRSPTLAEIGAAMGVRVASVQSVLASLKERNLVTWEPGKFRTVKPTVKGRI